MAAMIAASDSVTSDQLEGVTYGGVDDGTHNPSSRDSFWGDEVW